jgi:hypothetical protein
MENADSPVEKTAGLGLVRSYRGRYYYPVRWVKPIGSAIFILGIQLQGDYDLFSPSHYWTPSPWSLALAPWSKYLNTDRYTSLYSNPLPLYWIPFTLEPGTMNRSPCVRLHLYRCFDPWELALIDNTIACYTALQRILRQLPEGTRGGTKAHPRLGGWYTNWVKQCWLEHG